MQKTSIGSLFAMCIFLMVICVAIPHYYVDAIRAPKWEIVTAPQDTVILVQPTIVLENVVVTIYHPVKGQTDDTPDEVASGRKFDIWKATELDWIAVSRDLHTRWGGLLNFGDIVQVSGAGHLDGFYNVQDTMNPRYKMCVDILRTPGTKNDRFENATLTIRKVS